MAGDNTFGALLRMVGLDDEWAGAVDTAERTGQSFRDAIRRATGASASTREPAGARGNGRLLPPAAGPLVRDFSAPLPPRMQTGPYGERLPGVLPLSAVTRPGAPEAGIQPHDAAQAMQRYARTPSLQRDPVTAARITDIGVGQGVAPGRPQPDAWRVPPEPAGFLTEQQPPQPFFGDRPADEGRRYLAGGPFGAPMSAGRYARDVESGRTPTSAVRRLNAPEWLARNQLPTLPWRGQRPQDPFAR